MRRRRSSALAATLRHRDFRALIVAAAVSEAGGWAYFVGLSVYVYDQTHSATWIGLVTIGRIVPGLVFGAYGGVLADRFERVRLMVILDLLSAAVMAGLAVDIALKGSPAGTIAIAALSVILGRVYDPATAALTPLLVPESDLAAANTLRNTVSNLAVIAGPGIGALLLALGSPQLCMVINAASFLFSAALTATIKVRSQPVDVTEGGAAGVARQMVVGLRTVASSSSATLLAALSVIATFVYGTDTVLFVEIAVNKLHTGPNGYGILLAGLGVGGILAAGLANRVASWTRLASALLFGLAFYCVPSVLFLVVHSAGIGFVIEVVRGAGTLIVDVTALTALQRTMPREALGRAIGAFFTAVYAAGALGSIVAPVMLRLIDLNATIVVLSIDLPLACLFGWPFLAAMDRANLARVELLAPRVALFEQATLFAEAPRASLEQLAAASGDVTFPAGFDVVREGEEADALYVVRAGALAVHATSDDGMERPLARLGAGDVFGEIGLLNHVPRTATVTAEEAVDLLRVDGSTFLEVLAHNPASTSLLEGASARLARSARLVPHVAPREPSGEGAAPVVIAEESEPS